jgi:hypothetical protein
MSWSVSYSGKVKAAKKACKASFKGQKSYFVGADGTVSLEGKIMEIARKLVVAGLKGQKLDANVSVSASGHAIQSFDGTANVATGQNVSVDVHLIA